MNEERIMKIEKIVCGAYAENAYCIDGELLIDPGDDLPTLARLAGGIKAILLTHGHFDHMLAAEELQKRTGVPVYGASAGRAPCFRTHP